MKVQAEPVLLTYPANSKIEVLMNLEEKNVPVANFNDENGVRHKLWRIDNRLKLQQYKEVIEQIDSFYIADGHHRIGSTALNAKITWIKVKNIPDRKVSTLCTVTLFPTSLLKFTIIIVL